MSYFFFFFNDTATTEIYTLSLHDALPIFRRLREEERGEGEVDVGAVSVEAVASGKDQGDDGARGTEALQLLHHVREDRFGGAGAEDDEEFVLNIGDRKSVV